MGENRDNVHRLGKRELGRHAFETRMPDRIANIINGETGQNRATGVISKLAELLERDDEVDVAYLCDFSVIQISKLHGEGDHFCGYRNIQMLLPMSHPTYSISALQEIIEKGWDQGFNPHGRLETGGIISTRKHIGTSEAEVLFRTLAIPCKTAVFEGNNAWRELLDSVEAYFIAGLSTPPPWNRVHKTTLKPVFLQRPSHSVTIIGFERGMNGKRQLLVFDPAYQPSMPENASLPKSGFRSRLVLYRYRRNERYLKRHSAFETLYTIQE